MSVHSPQLTSHGVSADQSLLKALLKYLETQLVKCSIARSSAAETAEWADVCSVKSMTGSFALPRSLEAAQLPPVFPRVTAGVNPFDTKLALALFL